MRASRHAPLGLDRLYVRVRKKVAPPPDSPAAFGQPSLSAGGTRAFPVLSICCGVPATAIAYSLNFTVVPSGPLGNLTTWPVGQSPPQKVSSLNSPSGAVVANAAIMPAGVNGAIDVYVTNATDVLFDINDYFAVTSAM